MKPTEKQSFQTNCICSICGTSMEDDISGFCENGHDDWLELKDEIHHYQKASKNLKIPVAELIEKLLILNE